MRYSAFLLSHDHANRIVWTRLSHVIIYLLKTETGLLSWHPLFVQKQIYTLYCPCYLLSDFNVSRYTCIYYRYNWKVYIHLFTMEKVNKEGECARATSSARKMEKGITPRLVRGSILGQPFLSWPPCERGQAAHSHASS